MRMGGQMGNKNRMASNLQILKVIAEKNILIVKGSVPGANGSTLTIRR
jgi:large subunit ribosomal protein L3